MDLHELAAGKLTALFARTASRDLFDTHHLLTKTKLNLEQLRLAFILYVGMSSIQDFQQLSPESLLFDEEDFQQQLLPVLRNTKNREDYRLWKITKFHECKQALSLIFPFKPEEVEFLKNLIEKGEIHPSLLTKESAMQTKIENLPSLQWRSALARLPMQQN